MADVVINGYFAYFYFFIYLFVPGFITALSIKLPFQSILAYVLTGFVLSIFITQLFALSLSILDADLSVCLRLLIVYSFALAVFKFQTIKQNLRLIDYSDLKYIAAPCLVSLPILMVNGGLLDELADAWWHMSYANKIAQTNSIFLERHHLSGIEIIEARSYLSYLPGWHLLLALIMLSSGLDLPVIWHLLASYLVIFTLISYYLFAQSLFNNSFISSLSIIFLCFFAGGLNSYFRVSPWPGNVAYIIWYFSYFLSFSIFNQYQTAGIKTGSSFCLNFIKWMFLTQTKTISLLAICLYLILTIHASEVFWFVVSFISYIVCSSVLIDPKPKEIAVDQKVLNIYVFIFLIIASFVFFNSKSNYLNLDLTFAGLQIIFFYIGYSLLQRSPVDTKVKFAIVIIGCLILTIVNIDFKQFVTLFNPTGTMLSPGGFHRPYITSGLLGGELILPEWEHQLREGLLYAGLIALPLSIYLYIMKPSRGSLFLSANCIFAWLTLLSPYLFTFLNVFTPYASTYRVQLLIFHPIIIASALYLLCSKDFLNKKINQP